ncbi:U2 snRNP complex subunit LEA1 KNAG_0D01050 [Huiozyma naganishii CBS 8797]|uniref:U2 small nuclear ribonucleoprotein A' n=1 Tax=Huiozyma naganishii (strain ATCC MYA-139 / BCRC 22969 / CBS 8797 / KCTC 17520 / NBRC 10181 / NCYC 3082 / Yp74L-3) TaxID=1071383 RepID=J7RXN4_HUIN7|nr:hypothetical protein KNAG_0D01050 [Kazachstania naganishii CBS 8797]CCK69857.1 hypothetical protein KNAG_0D01050 [Kazachstania naganishii CBS 8797]
MQLTPSIVTDAPSYYVNHLQRQYNLDKVVILRDLGLENDSISMPTSLKRLAFPTHIIDLTNNELTSIPNLSPRQDIHTLLLARNRISLVDGRALPCKLRNLVLTSNKIDRFELLSSLRFAPRTLKVLSLRGNPICHLEDYRINVIRYLPYLQSLDFTTVTKDERLAARKLKKLNPVAEESVSLSSIVTTSTNKDKETELMDLVVSKMSEEQRKNLVDQLNKATSLEEISRLEKILSGGA